MNAIDVIILTRNAVAIDLGREHSRTREGVKIKELVAEYQGKLVVGGSNSLNEADISHYIRITVADELQARRLAEALLGVDGIEAAYVKPTEALP